jgi:hypothetical protein
MMITPIKSKQDVVRALNDRDMAFSSATEVVNQKGVKIVTDQLNRLLRMQRKIHVIVVERR